MYLISHFLLDFFGWSFKAEDRIPDRCILIAAPHTSNWDFPMMLAYGVMLKLNYSWLGKHTLFRGPLGPLMKMLGGIPVDRTRRNDYVNVLSDEIISMKDCILIIPPEGTRARSEYWRSGFMHIARKVNFPIVFGRLDYHERNLTFSGPVSNSLSDDEIITCAQSFYKDAKGLYPKNFGPVRFKEKTQS